MALRATQPPGDTIQERLAAVGIGPENGFEPIVFLSQGGKQTNHLLSEIGHRDPTSFSGELYASTGVFEQSGKDIKRDQGHLRAVTCMAFDCDLADYLGLEGDDRKALYQISLEELEGYLSAQRKLIHETFEKCSLPIHRLDVSGHGHHAYIYIDPQDRERIDDARATHKSLIAELNRAAGVQLADPKVSDTGTRVTRIPGSFNNKGSVPKLVRTLYYQPDTFSRLSIAATAPKAQAPVAVPEVGSVLSVKDRQNIVNALSPSWTLGQKHNLGLAVAGAFARAGIPESETADVVRELSENDERPDDRQKSVRDTYMKVRIGSAVQGYTGLRDFLSPMACDFIDGILTRYREANAPKVDLPSKPRVEVKSATDEETREGDKKREIAIVNAINPIPESAFYGWFGDYRTIVAPTTEAADALHLGSALTVIGAMVGRRIGVENGADPVYPNLFTMLIGSTGWSRKDTAMKRAVYQMPRSYSPEQSIVPLYVTVSDITSSQGIIQIFDDNKSNPTVLVKLTEVTTLFENMMRKGTTDIGDRLIEFWDNPPEVQVNRRLNAQKIERPSLSILAATQPGRLADAMSHQHIISGFANRWLFLTGARKPRMAAPPPLNTKQLWKLYEDANDKITGGTYRAGQMIRRHPDTNDRWNAWYEEISSDEEDEEIQAMRSRHQVLALKVAALYAITDGRSVIESRHLDPAIELIEWMWRNVHFLMRSWGVSNWTHIQQRIETVLLRGPIGKRALAQKCNNRRWTIREFWQVFDAMVKTDMILIDSQGMCSWNRAD